MSPKFKTSIESCRRFLNYPELDPELYYSLVSSDKDKGMNPVASAEILTDLDNYLFDIVRPKKKKKKDLRVFYGFGKIKNNGFKRNALTVMYENSNAIGNDDFVNRKMKVVYVRNQTKEERQLMESAGIRLTEYEFSFNDYSVENVIAALYDSIFETEESSDEIRNKLNGKIHKFYFNRLKAMCDSKTLF